MKLCGCDPSYLGFCISCFDEDRLVDFLFIKTMTNCDTTDRILIIGNQFTSFVERNGISSMTIEIPFYNWKNPKSYSQHIALYYHLLCLCKLLGIKVVEVSAKTVKKHLGSGSMDKDQVIAFISQTTVGKSVNPDCLTNDGEREALHDSIAIGMYGLDFRLFGIGGVA